MPIAVQSKLSGFDVHIAGKRTVKSKIILQNGFQFHPIHIDRSKRNPLKLLNYF